jgi:hypothetical protein
MTQRANCSQSLPLVSRDSSLSQRTVQQTGTNVSPMWIRQNQLPATFQHERVSPLWTRLSETSLP